jgi:hypothetical protein
MNTQPCPLCPSCNATMTPAVVTQWAETGKLGWTLAGRWVEAQTGWALEERKRWSCKCGFLSTVKVKVLSFVPYQQMWDKTGSR